MLLGTLADGAAWLVACPNGAGSPPRSLLHACWRPARPSGAEIGVASTKAYTSQIVAITMMSLVLSEDAISKRQRRDEIIDSLCNLPGECKLERRGVQEEQLCWVEGCDDRCLCRYRDYRCWCTALCLAFRACNMV